jgi:hypothetical protein
MNGITRRRVLGMISMFAATALRPSAQTETAIQVFKEPTCGCCSLWVEHLRKAGFRATVTDVADMAAIKSKHRVPAQARSCHTALVGGYVVEGHVPAADVQRMLKERPAIVGIGVPGMPIGSPGMEVAGMKPHPYDVLAFDKAGETRVFASHR